MYVEKSAPTGHPYCSLDTCNITSVCLRFGSASLHLSPVARKPKFGDANGSEQLAINVKEDVGREIEDEKNGRQSRVSSREK